MCHATSIHATEPRQGHRVTLVRHEAWAQLSVSNPPHGYFDSSSEREMLRALDEVEAMPDIRAVVVTGGQTGIFVRHYDIETLERRGRTMVRKGLHFSVESPPKASAFHQCTDRIQSSKCIYIAAVNGTCMGGGLELALACHLRYAQAGNYLLGLPEVQLGLLPGAGGTQRLGQAIGPTRALEMLLLGTCIGPKEAAEIGLVHATVPDAVSHSQAVARTLSRRSPEALAHIVNLHTLACRSGGQGYEAERGAFAELLRTPFALEAMAAFNAGQRSFPESV